MKYLASISLNWWVRWIYLSLQVIDLSSRWTRPHLIVCDFLWILIIICRFIYLIKIFIYSTFIVIIVARIGEWHTTFSIIELSCLKELYIFLQKDIYSFKYNHILYDIVKKVKGKYANKVKILKLVINNDKILTNNMIKSKRSKYLYFRIYNFDAKVIDWILIDWSWYFSKSKWTQKQDEKLKTLRTAQHCIQMVKLRRKNHLFKWKEGRKKRCIKVILVKKTQNHPSLCHSCYSKTN